MRFRFLFLWLTALCSAAGCTPKQTGVTLTWAVGRDATGTHRHLIEMFEAAHPGVRVRLLEMPEDTGAQHSAYVTYLLNRDASIDVYTLDIIWPAEFASARWVLALDEWLDQTGRAAFLDGPISGCVWQGRLYAVPWFTDAGVLYYRKDLLEEAGLSPPRTWEELVRQASSLSAPPDRYGYVFQGAQYEGLVCNWLEFLWGNGGAVFDAAGEVALDSPAAIQALQFLVDLIHTHRLSPPGVTTYKEEESRQVFTNGGAVFLRNWPYVWSLAQDPARGSQVAGQVGIAPVPGRDGGSAATLGGWNLAISAFSRHPDQAWQLIAFLTGAEAQKQFALRGGRLPTRHALYADAEILAFAPHYADFYEAFVSARARPARPEYPQISDRLQIALHKALTRELTPEAALQQAAEQIRRITGGS